MACADTNFESAWYSLWKLRTKAGLRPLPTVTTLRVCQLVIETTLDTFSVVPIVLCHISMGCHILLHMIVLMVQQRISINLQIFFHCPITFWINNCHNKKNWHTYSKISWPTPHYLEILYRSTTSYTCKYRVYPKDWYTIVSIEPIFYSKVQRGN